MYSINLHFGYEESTYGISHEFLVRDPQDNVDSDEIAEELAELLDCETGDPSFNYDVIPLEIPESIITRIKAQGVQEHLNAVKEEEKRRQYIAAIKYSQLNDKSYFHRCPRCGHVMRDGVIRNALSRHADVYVCHGCGTEEALLDAAGATTPLSDWFVFKQLEQYGEFPTEANLLVAIDPEISVLDDGSRIVETTFECWFPIAEKLGIDLDSCDNGWINLYAMYNLKTRRLYMAYTLDQESQNETYYYVPTEAEKETVIASMEACAKREGFGNILIMAAYYTSEEGEQCPNS